MLSIVHWVESREAPVYEDEVGEASGNEAVLATISVGCGLDLVDMDGEFPNSSSIQSVNSPHLVRAKLCRMRYFGDALHVRDFHDLLQGLAMR